MKQPIIKTELGNFQVTELHWAEFNGQLICAVTCIGKSPEISPMRSTWNVENFGLDDVINEDGSIDVYCATSRNFKGKLFLTKQQQQNE